MEGGEEWRSFGQEKMWAERPAALAHLVLSAVRVKRWTVCPVGDLSASSPGAMMEWRQDDVAVSQILMWPSSPQLKRRVGESQSRELVPPQCPSSLQWRVPNLASMRMISSFTVDVASSLPPCGGRAMLMIASFNSVENSQDALTISLNSGCSSMLFIFVVVYLGS